MTPSGAFFREWILPGNDQEGIAVVDCGNSFVFVAEDVGPEIWAYQFAGCLCPAVPSPMPLPVD